MLFSSRKWVCLSIVLIIGLTISTSGLTILFLNISKEHYSLQGKFNDISSQVEDLKVIVDKMKSNSNNLETQGLTSQQIYGLVEPSVVKITAKVMRNYGLIPYAQGSGFIYDASGVIITNYHVIEGAYAIDVTFLDGTIVEAELVGSDPYSDLAVIKIDSTQMELHPLIIGDSSLLEVGDTVFAIGNPFGLSGSMTEGIISQLDRTLSTQFGYLIVGVIQTDAAINPGNSGGPLLNVWGEVIGINSAIASESGDFSGVGFAIPSDLMVRVISSLIKDGTYAHPWMGLAGVDVTPAITGAMNLSYSRGFLVTYVAPESPVKKAGIKAGNTTAIIDGKRINIGGDVIIGIDEIEVRRLEDLLVYIEYNRIPNDEVVLKIYRESAIISVLVELEERQLIS